jgi:glycine/D-amino acid oxidase-like deaminating enzyme
MADPFPLEPSLWAATAPPPVPTPSLQESVTTDVCVVGGGYAGLSTALHLAERGTSVVVLEAREPGWGASGRNGGQVIPGLKYDPDELIAKFGEERGRRLVAFAAGTADAVFDLIAKHAMDVPLVRSGWIQGAHTLEGMRQVEQRASQWSRLGVAGARSFGKAESERLIGTDKYFGGWIDPRGGGIQPLAYVRALCAAAIKAGAKVHGLSPVVSLRREGSKWVVTTSGGARVLASRVVLATNGYTGDLLPSLRKSIIAPNSYQIATAPLSHNLRRSILPEGQVTSDTRNLLFYFRLDHEGRLLMGGRGPFREPKSNGDWGHLERVAVKMFPQLRDVEIVHRWCGRVAITRDFLPHLHEPAPGLLVDIGCMGRGVGLQTAMGQAMATYITTGKPDALPVPLTPVKALPLHMFHRAYLSAIIAYYRLQDGGVA